MTEFHADCTINIHLEARGQPAKLAWSCSLVYAKRGRIVLARGFLGKMGREEAELAALGFGLAQAHRLQQEKVDLAATFPVEGIDGDGKRAGRTAAPGIKSKRSELMESWQRFRLRRIARINPEEAQLLRETAGKAFERKRKLEEE
jgi:hypothetical protein